MQKINYSIISGSTRQKSQSRKVADFIYNLLLKYNKKESIQIIDFSKDNFPLWDEAILTCGVDWNEDWSEISKKLKISDAIIIVAPEWNGMAPPQLMNFFQLCSHQELAHKPGLIVSVSSSQGGAYPVTELRMSTFKNTRICYIPENVIIRDVNSVLNDFEFSNSDNDQYIRGRIQNALTILNIYAAAFKPIRDHELVINSQYPYGM